MDLGENKVPEVFKTENGVEYTKTTVKDISGIPKESEITLEEYQNLKDIEIRVFRTNTNRRLVEEDETYQEYELRRAINKKADKRRERGILTWNSFYMGTKTEEKEEKLKQLIKDGNKD